MQAQTKHEKKSKLRKGDEVQVLVGRSKTTVGKIDRIDFKNEKVYVSGANLYKRHRKPDTKNPDGGIVEKSMPMHISNVALVDTKSKKPTKIAYRIDDTKKVRVAKRSKAVIS